MAKRRENYETARMVIDRLEKKGPATPKQLRDELGVHNTTMNRNLRGILLKKLGIVERLDNDKYGLKWHLPEEDEVKLHYHRAKRKLRRNPTHKEMAGLIKEGPDEALALLFKYIPFYREPDQNEISSAASEVWNMIVWGGLYGRFKTKKDLYDMGVTKLVIDGVDRHTFDQLMNDEPPIRLDEARSYVEAFPEMIPEISHVKEDAQISYRIEWPDDIKNILPSSYWRKQFEARVPRKLDQKLYRRYKDFLDRNDDYALARISEMAWMCTPSQEAMADLLRWMKEPEKRKHALTALSYFCKNGLEVGQLDEQTQKSVANSLLDSFFGETSDDFMYEQALEIIEMLDARDEAIVAKSKEFIFTSLRTGLDDVRCRKLGEWLAKDPSLRKELIEGVEDIMADAENDQVAKLCKRFIKSI